MFDEEHRDALAPEGPGNLGVSPKESFPPKCLGEFPIRYLTHRSVDNRQEIWRSSYFPSIFGFHSLAKRCASAIWAGVILELTISL